MSDTGHWPGIYRNFLSLPEGQSNLNGAGTVLVPVPYDSTTSFRSGARDGPGAIIEASYGLEDYDGELGVDVSKMGIHTTPALEPHMGGPDEMLSRVREAVQGYASMGKVVGVLGGEHSITVGSVQAHLKVHPDLSVLYLDAHPDLRTEYMGTPWGHASGARRIHEMCHLLLVGVRSLCQEEDEFIRTSKLPTWPWPPNASDAEIQREVVESLGPTVYVSVDLDVLDPSVMPAVGTPEPGGLSWYQLIGLLRAVAESRRIVGFDVCELAPKEGPPACAYTAAKLVYKLAAYSMFLGTENGSLARPLTRNNES